MSPNLNEVMAQMRERLQKVDPNNRKVVAVFQMKSGGVNWVIDTKDLKVYEGTAENPDATSTLELSTMFQMLKKELTFEDAVAQGKLKVEGNVELVAKASSAHN